MKRKEGHFPHPPLVTRADRQMEPAPARGPRKRRSGPPCPDAERQPRGLAQGTGPSDGPPAWLPPRGALGGVGEPRAEGAPAAHRQRGTGGGGGSSGARRRRDVPSPCHDPRVPSNLPQGGAPGGRAPESQTPGRWHAGLSRPLSRVRGPATSPLRWPWLQAGRSGLHSLNPRLQVSGWRLALRPQWREGPGNGGWFYVCGSFLVLRWGAGLLACTRGTGDQGSGLCDSRQALPVGVSAAFPSPPTSICMPRPPSHLPWALPRWLFEN